MAIRLLSGIQDLAASYDGFILDLWGVVHDGYQPFPGAIEVLNRLKAAGKGTLLLSNAPRRRATVAEGLAAMGIGPEQYGRVHSSGEEAWQALKDRADPWFAGLGVACLHLGPERDRGMLEGLDLEEVQTPAEADFILNTGVDRDEETVADYEALLRQGAEGGLPMVCANADREALRGDVRVICAGALADRYAALGGEVRRFGKPDPAMFESALGLLGLKDRTRALAIGDSLATDIRGAERTGIAAVLVTGGLHAAELGLEASGDRLPADDRLVALLDRENLHPIAAIPRLRW
ncbi:MAG: TIGR01459 family HAD-type hydrolase [Alphaproteobacteria bacterium]|nr:TIGR01459 family HAD-type hydrolase [Alphaproteobacteria bacterium]